MSLTLQADEQLALLQHEKVDLLKRLEEDQEDLNELMKKHKALIAQVLHSGLSSSVCRCIFESPFILKSNLCDLSLLQSSSDISQIRELQAELEELKKQRHSLQEEVTFVRQSEHEVYESHAILSKTASFRWSTVTLTGVLVH